MANPADGALTTYHHNEIPAWELAKLLDRLPAKAEKLLLFTECYGGNMATSKYFKARKNTCVLSAGSPGQEVAFGGYEDDAAKALKPGKGRTAQDVHDAGMAGRRTEFDKKPGMRREYGEDPLVRGALAPKKFSLEPTRPEGPIHSRHVVVFMGRPGESEYVSRTVTKKDPRTGVVETHTVIDGTGTKKTFKDTDTRDAIVNAFNGQPNTTVTTCGGDGGKGWDQQGTVSGLLRAIDAAAAAMKKAMAQGKKEQFILFAGDHGSGIARPGFKLPKIAPKTPPKGAPKKAPKNTRTSLVAPFQPFGPNSAYAMQLGREPTSRPGFAVALAFDGAPQPLTRAPDGTAARVFAAGHVVLEATLSDGSVLRLTDHDEQPFTYGDPATLGDDPGDRLDLFFSVPTATFVGPVAAGPLELALVNDTARDLSVADVWQSTGPMPLAGEIAGAGASRRGCLPALVGLGILGPTA